MSNSGHIRHLTRQQVDTSKWDACIANAANGLIYAYSFYLDNMARNWDALVLNDYEAVMPLTWNRKFGIAYLYQPFLAAQLGVFGNNLNASLTEKFIQNIPRKFRFVEISLNSTNTFESTSYELITRKNFLLSLNSSYAVLSAVYNDNIRRNLKKAAQSGCMLAKNINAEDVISLAVRQINTYGKAEKENTDNFRRLYNILEQKQMATTYGITVSGELMASAIFFLSHGRAYYILVGNNPAGKHTGASHALIDGFIKDNAGKNILLDFEGSDIPGLAAFYGGFGARLEEYPFLKINRLPLFLKWLKN